MDEDKFTFAYRIIQMNRCEPASTESDYCLSLPSYD